MNNFILIIFTGGRVEKQHISVLYTESGQIPVIYAFGEESGRELHKWTYKEIDEDPTRHSENSKNLSQISKPNSIVYVVLGNDKQENGCIYQWLISKIGDIDKKIFIHVGGDTGTTLNDVNQVFPSDACPLPGQFRQYSSYAEFKLPKTKIPVGEDAANFYGKSIAFLISAKDEAKYEKARSDLFAAANGFWEARKERHMKAILMLLPLDIDLQGLVACEELKRGDYLEEIRNAVAGYGLESLQLLDPAARNTLNNLIQIIQDAGKRVEDVLNKAKNYDDGKSFHDWYCEFVRGAQEERQPSS